MAPRARVGSDMHSFNRSSLGSGVVANWSVALRRLISTITRCRVRSGLSGDGRIASGLGIDDGLSPEERTTQDAMTRAMLKRTLADAQWHALAMATLTLCDTRSTC